jgi:rhodanese-related sulfurtransferase
VRHSDFETLMREEFGPAQAAMIARDHALTVLDSRTPAEALAAGIPPRRVWLAVCEEYAVPPERRFGRDRPPEGTRPG